MPAASVETAAKAFLDYYAGKTVRSETIRWHLDMAERVRDLAVATRENGGDTVGIAG